MCSYWKHISTCSHIFFPKLRSKYLAIIMDLIIFWLSASAARPITRCSLSDGSGGIKAWGSEGGNSKLLSNHAAYTPKVHWLRVSAFSWSKIKLSEFGLSCLCNHPQHDCYICRSRELIWNYVYEFTGIWRPFTQSEQVRVSVRKYR